MYEFCHYTDHCMQCGNCCRFRLVKPNLSKEDDLKIRKAFFYKKSILYPYSLNKMTISISPSERKTMIAEAKRLKKKIKILPLKVLFRNGKLKILSYFIDEDVCPFLENNKCTIYEKRPKVCRIFPRKPKVKIEKDRSPDITFEEALERYRKWWIKHNKRKSRVKVKKKTR